MTIPVSPRDSVAGSPPRSLHEQKAVPRDSEQLHQFPEENKDLQETLNQAQSTDKGVKMLPPASLDGSDSQELVSYIKAQAERIDGLESKMKQSNETNHPVDYLKEQGKINELERQNGQLLDEIKKQKSDKSWVRNLVAHDDLERKFRENMISGIADLQADIAALKAKTVDPDTKKARPELQQSWKSQLTTTRL